MFRNGRKIESYKGARNLNDLADFVTTNKEQAGAAAADDGKVPEPAAKEAEPAVVKLEKDNFEEVPAFPIEVQRPARARRHGRPPCTG